VKARTLFDAEHAGYAADDTTDGAADNGANRTGSALTFPRTAFHAARHTLRLSDGRDGDDGKDGGSSDKTANHGCLPR
jgi:hypothetical protein